ncbi:alpha/beta fold hydrolase, partial [Paenibacillus kobensis]|uniref:alpha/beta fold hydrolase n=1 Tax=Paenibacillus kobensis TaxID=59841 RepID=UPI0013E2BCCF
MSEMIEVERGVKLFVTENGTGKPLVMVHGWPVHHAMYEYQSSWLPAHGFRCILLDLRGFGHSDKPWSGYSYDRLAEDIHVIVQKLRLDRFTLLGFSMGGAVAIRYASRYGGHGLERL